MTWQSVIHARRSAGIKAKARKGIGIRSSITAHKSSGSRLVLRDASNPDVKLCSQRG